MDALFYWTGILFWLFVVLVLFFWVTGKITVEKVKADD